ncbi:YbjN domain-containing protein [Cellulomonas triticagri]|uniref:YbjN domain-containing protein n=1 Tax=Cellulomonas triticagri TaxID=2483352 RepID=A0A3M2IS83_9CELL|nr:YbjN domain-containing protein [Cellulomonas triticagri]RMI04792.1 YbjN domain-containing protein [Cellulomonas triticagri]
MGLFRNRRPRRGDEHASGSGGGAGRAPGSRTPVPVNPGRGGLRAGTPLAGTVDDGRPTPLSTDRVVRWFRDNDFHYFTDDDGDLGGLWRGRLFYFFLFGERQEILQVRGQWHREVALERLEEVLDACTEWNAERIWPKAYVRVRDNGMVHVVAEVSTDLEHGATDEQLSQILFCGLSSSSTFFDAIDELYPDPAAVAP